MHLHADISFNTGKGMYMQGQVFFGTPGLDIAGTDSLTNPDFFKTADSESLFSIGNVTGFDDQNYAVSAIMPNSTKEGEKISIYFKTTAGVQEWCYQLKAFQEEKQDTEKTETPATKTTKKDAKITASNKTFKAKTKTKKYTVTLKSGSKAIKNAKLTLKVNKKTYKATTNKKGKATFKITKLTKKGKYTAAIKFAGNKTYKKVSKKVKITVRRL